MQDNSVFGQPNNFQIVWEVNCFLEKNTETASLLVAIIDIWKYFFRYLIFLYLDFWIVKNGVLVVPSLCKWDMYECMICLRCKNLYDEINQILSKVPLLKCRNQGIL